MHMIWGLFVIAAKPMDVSEEHLRILTSPTPHTSTHECGHCFPSNHPSIIYTQLDMVLKHISDYVFPLYKILQWLPQT